MYRTILVALENTRTDEAILEHIVPLARLCKAKLLFVHVADGWQARAKDQLNLAESQEMREDREYLDKIRERFQSQGIESGAQLLWGEPANEIVKFAEEQGVDLIAMSTHGHRFVKDVLYGSTASKVRHTVSIPVLLLRAQ